MSGITLADTLNINKLVFIRSLDAGEIGPSRRIVEDLVALSLDGGTSVEEHDVGNESELLRLLAQLAQRAEDGLRPILHFDCHGCDKKGLLLEPANEFISWARLADALRSLNVATKNNLVCFFGVCFGLHLSFQLNLSKPTPYFLTIAPENEISVGMLEHLTVPFYRRVIQTGNITQSYDELLNPALKLFHCKEIFAKALARYIAANCMGAEKRVRQELMVTSLLASRRIENPSRTQLRNIRAEVRAKLAPHRAFERYAPLFLIGRDPGFTFKQVKRRAESERKRIVRTRINVRR